MSEGEGFCVKWNFASIFLVFFLCHCLFMFLMILKSKKSKMNLLFWIATILISFFTMNCCESECLQLKIKVFYWRTWWVYIEIKILSLMFSLNRYLESTLFGEEKRLIWLNYFTQNRRRSLCQRREIWS